jgi:hypothetical protein
MNLEEKPVNISNTLLLPHLNNSELESNYYLSTNSTQAFFLEDNY